MKVIILAGGLGTRFAEETSIKPKPMIEVGGKPMLWHIMNIYAKQGFDDFLIATGYKNEVIDQWVKEITEPWKIETLFTGVENQTGGRIRIALDYLGAERVMITYGDGVGNIDIRGVISKHESEGNIVTLTAVRPPARFGFLQIEGEVVKDFGEKNQADAGWINGGFFVVDKSIASYIHSDTEPFETGALPRLVLEGRLGAYKHFGFWKPMDTLREKNELEAMVSAGNPPWCI